ncbi:MAG TPA: hypothetical protein VI036_14565 [Propionibacteriaceae bacterium]
MTHIDVDFRPRGIHRPGGEPQPPNSSRQANVGLSVGVCPADGGDGVVLSGAVLASAGVMAANMHPDHAILYRVAALD